MHTFRAPRALSPARLAARPSLSFSPTEAGSWAGTSDTQRQPLPSGSLQSGALEPGRAGPQAWVSSAHQACVPPSRPSSSWWTAPRTSTITAAKGTALTGGARSPCSFPRVTSVGPRKGWALPQPLPSVGAKSAPLVEGEGHLTRPRSLSWNGQSCNASPGLAGSRIRPCSLVSPGFHPTARLASPATKASG